MDKKKQLLLSIGLVLILVLMIVGISYAAFKFVGLGQKENTITTGAITMEYTESTNTISMTGALPTTDATGKVRLTKGEYFDFTIKSSIQGNTNINWEIAAEDVTPSSAKKMASKNIKLYLTKLDSTGAETQVMAPKVYNATTSANTKTGRPSGVMSLATGTMSASETTNYRLRMYVDEDYNPQGDGGGLSFSVKINAYGKVKEAPTGSKMKAYVTQADYNYDNDNLPETDFHTDAYRQNITSIITKNDNIVPKTAVESWDISEAQDGSVMAYVEKNNKVMQDSVNTEIHSTVSRVKDISKTIYATPLEAIDATNPYKLTIGGKGGIIANESMISYFKGFYNMTSIDLSVMDTSEVTDMSWMFRNCYNLTSLDLRNFDTSKVTNMSNIFGGCSSLTSLDVSKFDTSNVTDMSGMFSSCSLTSLDLRNFDTSKVTNMSNMFSYCGGLTTLDVSKFDTSNVTDMSWMFRNCYNLTSLDLRNFDTSKVTDMSYMFSDCMGLTSLDVSKFDTSNVTNMSSMFDSCYDLTNLDLRNFDTSKVTNMSEMFDSCYDLTSLDLRNFDTSKLTDMSRMFRQCGKLTQITVSNKWVIKSGASTNEMFSNCGTDHVTVV